MSIKTLKEMMGQEVESTVEYPLPQLETDALDAISSVQKYALAKIVLEHPEVNATLKRMAAFDTLCRYSVEPVYEMAQWVVEALHEYYGVDTEAYFNDFPFLGEHTELNEFSKEFITELSDMKMAGMPDVSAGMPDDGGSSGWMDKIASKFGFQDIGFKELMWLYIMNQAKQGMSKPDAEPNLMDNPPAPVVTEAVLAGIEEEPVDGLTEWVESLTASYTKEFGNRWGEVLYEQALEQYGLARCITEFGTLQQQFKQQVKSPDQIVAETKALIQTFTEAMGKASAFGKHAYKKEIDSLKRFLNNITSGTVTEQDDAGLESGMYNDTRPAPKPSAKVKADVKQRVGELSDIIADDKKEKRFYGDVKPAVYNAKESLNVIMDFLNLGTMDGYKRAQIHFGTLMSPITNLYPPTLVKFLAYANDGEESTVMKPVEK